MATDDLDVFPRPREVSLAGGGLGSAVELSAARDASLPPQGYELTISSGGTSLRYADEAGQRYGRQTLAQLAGMSDVPAGRIRDWPDFPVRGYMLDISRDRVPTMATLDWLISKLAELRYNHLELYTEHTFAYADHETVWRDASPITADELCRLDASCAAAGIELSANQNTFGHMTRWLTHPAYRDRAECPDGSHHPLANAHLPPWSLEPTSDNASFALGLVREMADNLMSKRVNIGCDEPFDLGLGRSEAAVASRGRPAVFLDHLHRLVDPLVAKGHDVQFWGDALVRHPELMDQLPDGGTAVVWNYEAPRPDTFGTEKFIGAELAEFLQLPDQSHRGFCSYVKPYAEAGYPFWVAPGTSSWNSLVGRWSNARKNLLDAATVGLDTGARGFLVTDWGDNGHPQPLAISLLGLAFGAGVAWCHEANHTVNAPPIVDRLLDAQAGSGVGAQLAQLGNIYARLGVFSFNGSPVLTSMIREARLPLVGELNSVAADELEILIEESLELFATTPFLGPRAEQTTAELVAVCRLARHGLWRLRQTRGDGQVDTTALPTDFEEAVALQRAAWLKTSRPGGLDDSINRLVPPA